MRKEIGSEFWDIPTTMAENHLFDGVTWFVSGRAALRAILQEIKKRHANITLKAALPSYLCESMISPFEKEGISFVFYPVKLDDCYLKADFSNASDCNIVLLLDYFGFSLPTDFKAAESIIIRDLTHSIFSKGYDDADYYFGSLRKWAGFMCGGFAYKKIGSLERPIVSSEQYFTLRMNAFDLKKKYMFEENTSKDYLALFKNAEEMLDECEIASSDSNEIKLAKYLDVDFIKTKRRENASILIKELNKYCLFKNLNQNDCPLFVPIICENRDELKQYLISQEIYCPTHWPKPNQVNSDFSDDLYDKELSLICDQRYNKDDMHRIANLINDFMRNN